MNPGLADFWVDGQVDPFATVAAHDLLTQNDHRPAPDAAQHLAAVCDGLQPLMAEVADRVGQNPSVFDINIAATQTLSHFHDELHAAVDRCGGLPAADIAARLCVGPAQMKALNELCPNDAKPVVASLVDAGMVTVVGEWCRWRYPVLGRIWQP